MPLLAEIVHIISGVSMTAVMAGAFAGAVAAGQLGGLRGFETPTGGIIPRIARVPPAPKPKRVRPPCKTVRTLFPH